MTDHLTDAEKSQTFQTLKTAAIRPVWTCLILGALLTAGCSSRSLTNAPVEDRVTGSARPVASVAAPVKPPMPGAENAGKPGYYTVKPGDVVIRIGLETGHNWRDIARWNNLASPYTIEIGQVLRVVPPANSDPVVVSRPVTPGSAAATAGTDGAAAASAARHSSAPAATSAPVATSVLPTPPAGDDDIAWIWPAQGALVAGFDEVKNKGFDIAGKAGDAVIAAADGKVVYAGSGLRGYGNLIILKHNNTFLTAYAHNQTLMIKEDQSVKKGQKIAEMGNSDADRVKLHFEIRRQGKPVDPAKYLPAR